MGISDLIDELKSVRDDHGEDIVVCVMSVARGEYQPVSYTGFDIDMNSAYIAPEAL